MDKSVIKAKLMSFVDNESWLLRAALCVYNHLPFNNRFSRGGKISAYCSMLHRCKFKFNGKNNTVKILGGCRLKNCNILVSGNNNSIVIKPFANLMGVDICFEDDNNSVTIGELSSFEGNVSLACIEGTKIEIGNDCMFSANISIRTGDSHSVTDMEGNRINPSKDVYIGNHAWIGNTVLITKGVYIPDNSIVGTGSVVTKSFDKDQSNVVIAGNPAKVVKSNISWERERLCLKENL